MTAFRSFPTCAALLVVCSCGGGDEPLSGLLITVDTTRADALTCYRGPEGLTPNIDRLAAEGVLYESAYSVAPMTLPAHASMLTGLYPLRHTVRTNGVSALPQSAHTLAEAARERGLRTAAFVAAVVLDEGFGLDQGFELYDVPRRPALQLDSYLEERGATDVIDGALEWLAKRDRSTRFFLWVHLFDPHAPYEPPEPFRARAPAGATQDYLGEVAKMDHEIGRLLDALRADGGLDDTLVVVVADHGEGLGDHGEYTHSGFCYEATIRVPFLLRYPDGHRKGERSSEMCSVVDVHPTFAEALGLDGGEDLDGISLYRRAAPDGRGVYFESYYGHLSYSWSPLAGWVGAEGKYLHSSKPEFYDLATDPAEERNLAGERADVIQRHRAAIARLASKSTLEPDDGSHLDPRLRAQIQKLGYAGAGAGAADVPHPLAPSSLPSPGERAGELRRLLAAMEHANEGRYADAVARLQPIVAANPLNFVALDQLSFCLMRAGRHAEMIEPLQRALADDPPRPDTHCYLAACLMAQDRHAEALPHLLRTLDLRPEHLPALGLIVDCLPALGRAADAAPFQRRYRELTR